MESRQLPTSLKVVAWLFIIGGICAAVEMIVSLLNSSLNINIGILGLFIGVGLLRLSRGWRTCALVFIWIGLIGVPLAGLLFLSGNSPLTLRLFGQPVGHVPKLLGALFAVGFFLLMLWQYRVLTRDDVRALFGLTPARRSEVSRRE